MKPNKPFSHADCEEEGPAEPEDIDTLIRSQFRERGGGGGVVPVSRRAGTARSLTSLTMGVGQSCITGLASNFSSEFLSRIRISSRSRSSCNEIDNNSVVPSGIEPIELTLNKILLFFLR
jgi:hypothetical protein